MPSTSGPARAGVFIYARDPQRLAEFYLHVLGMVRMRQTAEMLILRSPDLQLIIHAMPPEVGAALTIESPPRLRDDAAIKFFCTVGSLAEAAAQASSDGGGVLPDEWQGPGFVVRNAYDPEGNIFQVRQSTGRAPEGLAQSGREGQ